MNKWQFLHFQLYTQQKQSKYEKLKQANYIGLSRISTGQMLKQLFTIFSAISDSTALKLTAKPRNLLFFTKLPKNMTLKLKTLCNIDKNMNFKGIKSRSSTLLPVGKRMHYHQNAFNSAPGIQKQNIRQKTYYYTQHL